MKINTAVSLGGLAMKNPVTKVRARLLQEKNTQILLMYLALALLPPRAFHFMVGLATQRLVLQKFLLA